MSRRPVKGAKSATKERRPRQDPPQLSKDISNISKASKDSSVASKSSRQDGVSRSSQPQTHTMQGGATNHQNSHERTSPCHKAAPVEGRQSSEPTQRTISATAPIANKGLRQLYVVRHGERVDLTFGKGWIKNSFDKAGNYIRNDLNMPKKLPKRKSGPQDFSKDSPLTVQGHFQAGLVGEAMREEGIPISIVYASPSLRCVQTASSILAGLEQDCEISIEPGLFEWLGLYQSGVPRFMDPEELREFGFNIGMSHTPVWPVSKYNMEETTEQYYDRCYKTTKDILKKHEHEGGTTILFVAHKGSVEVCTRKLRGKAARDRATFHKLKDKVPYCGVACLQEKLQKPGKWELCDPLIPPMTLKGCPPYDWRIWV